MKSVLLLCAIWVQFITATAVLAADTDSKDELLRPGVAASSQRFTHAGAVDTADNPVIEMSGGKKEAEALGDVNPIMGRVTRVRGSRCLAELSNNSLDDYSVRYQIITEGRDGRVVRKESYSSALASKKSVSKSFICDRDQNLRIVITGGKKRAKPGQKKAPAVPAIEVSEEEVDSPVRESGLRPFEPFKR